MIPKECIRIVTALVALVMVVGAMAQLPPLYIVNGKRVRTIDTIPPEMIERVEMLPADEENIARYGEEASNGVILVTLTYDRAAHFLSDSLSFDRYIARHTEWNRNEDAARVVLRYTVAPDGRTEVKEVLESTDKRFRRRVLKAVEEAPLWQPATRQGTPVAFEGVLRVELPEGKRVPRQAELIIR